MNVSLTPNLEKFVQKKVRSGKYKSSSEVVREALRLLEEHDSLREIRLTQLKRQIADGVREADAGSTSILDIAAIKKQGRKRLGQK